MAEKRAIIIGEKDNVATALESINKGDTIVTKVGDSENSIINLTAKKEIPFGHKISLVNIKKGEPIVKYNSTIGLATSLITEGDYVHVHNVESTRGRGDKRIVKE
jgi:altronate dehydratase small subunit